MTLTPFEQSGTADCKVVHQFVSKNAVNNNTQRDAENHSLFQGKRYKEHWKFCEFVVGGASSKLQGLYEKQGPC